MTTILNPMRLQIFAVVILIFTIPIQGIHHMGITNKSYQEEEFIYKNSILFTIVNQRLTWKEAEVACKNAYENSQLAIVNTTGTKKFLAASLAESCLNIEHAWIGGHKSLTEDNRDPMNFWWNNGKKFSSDDMNCLTGLNQSEKVIKDCVGFLKKYHDVPQFIPLNCHLRRPFICEAVYTRDDDWIDMALSSYKIFYNWVTWEHASEMCRIQHNGHLATFRMKQEIEGVASIMLRGRPNLERAWTAGYYDHYLKQYVYAATPDEIAHGNKSRGQPFPPWVKNHPKMRGGCLVLDRHLTINALAEEKCTRMLPYICEKSKIDVMERFVVENTVYYLVYIKLNWEDAQQYCQIYKSNLVKLTIESLTDISYFMGEKKFEMQIIWVGAKEYTNYETFETELIWIKDNTTFDINDWPADMNGFDSEELIAEGRCLNLHLEGHDNSMIYPISCYFKQQFLCETTLDIERSR